MITCEISQRISIIKLNVHMLKLFAKYQSGYCVSLKDLMEENFTQYIEIKFPSDGKRGTSGVIHAAYADKIKQCIKNLNNFPKEFH